MQKCKLQLTTNGKSKYFFNIDYIINGNNFSFYYVDNGELYTIDYQNNIVSLIKKGELSYTLLLEKGKEYEVSILSNYGIIKAKLYTKKIDLSKKENQIILSFDYDLNIAGDISSYIVIARLLFSEEK